MARTDPKPRFRSAPSESAYLRDSMLFDQDKATHEFLTRVEAEVARARRKHAPIHSSHEGYAVIQEEVDEFWDEVKAQTHNPAAMLKELIHTAAMAARCATDIELIEVKAQ